MQRSNEDRCSNLVGSDDLLEQLAQWDHQVARWTPLCRLEINLTHGAAWKALISRYITVIPLIGDEPCIAVQSMSGWPLKKPVHSAMIAKVGAAARPSQPAAPGAARLPPPQQVSTS
jgi:hypothetical protein